MALMQVEFFSDILGMNMNMNVLLPQKTSVFAPFDMPETGAVLWEMVDFAGRELKRRGFISRRLTQSTQKRRDFASAFLLNI